MFHTAESPYNIVDATPFERDVIGELAEACQEEGIRLHLYYSILDWIRPDYPVGRTGQNTGKERRPDYPHYLQFMKNQVSELLTNYPNVEGLWFDGYWDHDSDSVPFNWRMPEFYRFIHSIKPRCLIGNNHHEATIEGEDFQMFERDLPGENTAGLSGQEVSQLPLEMCQTMNGMWGYKVSDQQYKSTGELIQLIARAASKNSNLLLNIGPQPNGELPTAALERLYGIGEWMRENSPSIYATHSTTYGEQPWGVTTQKANVLYLHVFDASATRIRLPWLGRQPRHVRSLETKHSLPYSTDRQARLLTINLPSDRNTPDYVVEIEN
jgi:alpha-L-fucosidase